MTYRRLRVGMVGGGPGAFIGPIHHTAAELDREIELVAAEAARDDGIDFVTIFTSNDHHLSAARHIIEVTDRALDDFAASGADRALNRRLMVVS